MSSASKQKKPAKGELPVDKPSCQQFSTLWFHWNIFVSFQISHVTSVTNVTSKRGMKKIGHSFIFLMSSVSPESLVKNPEKGGPPWNQTVLSASRHFLVSPEHLYKLSNFSCHQCHQQKKDKKIGHSFIFLMSSVSSMSPAKNPEKGEPPGIKLPLQ